MIYKLKNMLQDILKEKQDNKFEADLIISNVLKMHKCEWIFKKNIDKKYILKCIKLAKKRQKGMPIQYILKDWEFYGVPIKLTKGVLNK